MRIIWSQDRASFTVASMIECAFVVCVKNDKEYHIFVYTIGAGEMRYPIGKYSTEQRARDMLSILATWFKSDEAELQIFPDDETLDRFLLKVK